MINAETLEMQLSIEVFFEGDPSCGTDIAHMQNETLALRPVSLKPLLEHLSMALFAHSSKAD